MTLDGEFESAFQTKSTKMVNILPRKPKVFLLPHSAGSLDDQIATVVLEETMAVDVDGAGFLELWY